MKIGHERAFLNLCPEGKKVDYQALANQVRLEIDLNNQKISSYLTYFIGLISIVITLYLFLLDNHPPLVYSVIYLTLSFVIVLTFICKIRKIIVKNEREIDGYMGLQAYLAGSKMFVLEGTPKGIKNIMENLNKIPRVKKKDLMNIVREEDSKNNKKENENTSTSKTN